MQWELNILGTGDLRVKVPLNQNAPRSFAVRRDKCSGHQKGTDADPSLSPNIYNLITGLIYMHKQPAEQLLAISASI